MPFSWSFNHRMERHVMLSAESALGFSSPKKRLPLLHVCSSARLKPNYLPTTLAILSTTDRAFIGAAGLTAKSSSMHSKHVCVMQAFTVLNRIVQPFSNQSGKSSTVINMSSVTKYRACSASGSTSLCVWPTD